MGLSVSIGSLLLNLIEFDLIAFDLAPAPNGGVIENDQGLFSNIFAAELVEFDLIAFDLAPAPNGGLIENDQAPAPNGNLIVNDRAPLLETWSGPTQAKD
ncbi:alpha-1,3-glucanase [Aspergillus luchuensis]|uniref:Alpha-1,3-glucanase n=1 Tax=Aspergillus kawachii TaxID=1069201 RepID=A0A146G2I7_ASPKA|nr:alpha-1,3-glucanase [Aspergillus luchuensis]